jgi:dipeptidyl aminopeptidase/acylaminoacyl peptidase
MLPYESHGYMARESVGHVLAEMVAWLDTHMAVTDKTDAPAARAEGVR